MKKILRFLISRVFWFSLLIVVQIGIFAVILFNISSYSTYLYAAFVLFSLIIVIWLVAKDDNPSYKITWIILIMTLPVVGWFFYLKFGNKTLPHRYWEKIAANEAAHPALFTAEEGDTAALLEQYPRHRVLTDYIRNISGFPAYGGTQVEYAPLGEDFFRQLMLELPKAKKFIFLEYFILEKGLMWDSVLEILRERAAAGVEVCVIYDDFGCIQRLSASYPKELAGFNIKAVPYNPMRPIPALITATTARSVSSMARWASPAASIWPMNTSIRWSVSATGRIPPCCCVAPRCAALPVCSSSSGP